jgi:predicted dehydrogenase
MTRGVAIIGTGNAARHHAAAVKASGTFELRAVAGRDLRKTSAFVTAECPQAEAASISDVMASRRIDAVIIATPADAQHPIAIAAFEHGKHVLCEKPLATTVARAEAIERAWRMSGKVGMVNFCFRVIPEFEAFENQLRAGVCGDLNLIRAEWVLGSRLDPALPHDWKSDVHRGGGVLQNFGSHVIDYLLFGRPHVRAMAMHRSSSFGRHAEDNATLLFDVPGLCPVSIHLSTVTRPPVGHRVIAQGHRGTLTLFNTSRDCPGGPFGLRFSSANDVHTGELETRATFTPGGIALTTLFERVLVRFADAIEHRRDDDEPSIGAGVHAARIIESARAIEMPIGRVVSPAGKES